MRRSGWLAGVLGIGIMGLATDAGAAEGQAWYQRLSLRGYAQLRYNRLLETNPSLRCEQCDRSWGDQQTFSLRRARLVVSGDVHPHVSIYIQPDLATAAGNGQYYLQIRDLYGDIALDSDRELRLRVGQSKVPYGWENLQSSSQRLALDRSDAINSAAPNERDVGVFAYWAPLEIRKRFRELVDSGLKGSGDYGVVGVGVYAGQSGNRAELNNNLHWAARVSYPIRFASGQFFEPGVQAYSGLFSVPSNDTGLRTAGVGGPGIFPDQRVAGSLIWYPQPFGFQAEWNFGRGPEYDPRTNSIDTRPLQGGYVQLMYRVASAPLVGWTPFVRGHLYRGGKKQELDARSYFVREYELGVEWQPIPAFELTAQYVISDRRFEDSRARANYQEGNLLRLQAQLNY